MFSICSLIGNRQDSSGLIFSPDHLESMDVLNLGYQLASELSHIDLNQPSLPMIADDIICGILNNNIKISSDGAKYIAVENIGILFEEQLCLNVAALFKSYSRSVFLIIISSPTIIDHYYYPFKGNHNIKVNLSEVPYYILHR